jgi:integrase
MEDYIASKIADGRDVADSRSRIGLHILPAFGSIEVAHLTRDAIQKWHRGMVQEKARIRTSAGKAQQFRVTSDDADTIRRRQATANRCMTILKAGLNLAFQNEKVTTDAAWRKVKPFRGVDTARLRYLTVAEAKRLINVCDPDFKVIVQAALQTGGRYGQLAALTVADFNPDAGTVQMKTRKGDGNWKTYHVHLTAEGAAFFAELCAGRPKKTFLLGKAWYKSEQDPLMREACKRANIDPPMGFHGLRHTYASLSVMNGVPLLVLAKNLGHTTTAMVERHYGHMSASHVADAIRAGAPTFGFKPSKVVALR